MLILEKNMWIRDHGKIAMLIHVDKSRVSNNSMPIVGQINKTTNGKINCQIYNVNFG